MVVGVGLTTQREWPTENSDRTVYFKTVLGLILQAEAQKCLFTKGFGAYTLRDAHITG